MARTVEQVEADIAAVRARIVSGVQSVSSDDMTTRFDTANDPRALAILEAELAALRGAIVNTRMTFFRVGMRRG
jgi:hypothetical protein